ncbi:MAG: hypothetical protein HC780_16695 [Leptolyngbyaceae cyanobacterium CSU_1_3]|nr:hypothetical protein [Leptolyngbyaceae cyanobacterium CSU_1_3]
MDAFEPTPPPWTKSAVHAHVFSCPKCHQASTEAERVWINRRSPVFLEDYRKKWQEFYQCSCETVWWAWSNDRPPSELADGDRVRRDFLNPFDDL